MSTLNDLIIKCPWLASRKATPEDIDDALLLWSHLWLRNEVECVTTTNDFLLSVHASLVKKGSLTAGQAKGIINWATVSLRPRKFGKSNSTPTAAPAPAPVATWSGPPLSEIHTGYYTPATGVTFYVSRKTDASTTWVRLGKNGVFVAKQFPGDDVVVIRDQHLAELEEVAKDPLKALLTYGKATSKCGHCGRALEDPDSVRLGIGPICLAYYVGKASAATLRSLQHTNEMHVRSERDIYVAQQKKVSAVFAPPPGPIHRLGPTGPVGPVESGELLIDVFAELDEDSLSQAIDAPSATALPRTANGSVIITPEAAPPTRAPRLPTRR